jgi:hypothetical protein
MRWLPRVSGLEEGRQLAMTRFALLVVIAVAAFSAAAVSPAGAPGIGPQSAYAHTCYAGYVHAVFPWGHRCIRAGQFCKKVNNPQYHKYGFQCVNGKLRKTGTKKGT